MTEKQTFADLKERDLAAKRSLIIDAAERVFAVKPFHKVNIRDVAAEAGISHATIYRYFPDQQTLFLEAFMRGCEQVLDRIDAALAPREAEDPLEAAAAAFIAFLTENDHYFRMMTHFMLDGDLAPPLLEKLNNAQRALLDRIEGVFVARQVPEAPGPRLFRRFKRRSDFLSRLSRPGPDLGSRPHADAGAAPRQALQPKLMPAPSRACPRARYLNCGLKRLYGWERTSKTVSMPCCSSRARNFSMP